MIEERERNRDELLAITKTFVANEITLKMLGKLPRNLYRFLMDMDTWRKRESENYSETHEF